MQINFRFPLFLLLISSVIFLTSFSYKKSLQKGYLVYKDGSKKEGLISPFTGVDVNIKIKKDEKAKAEKVSTSLLKYIVLENEKDHSFDTLHALKIGIHFMSKFKIHDDVQLAHRIYNSDKVEGFVVYYSDYDFYGPGRSFMPSNNMIIYTRMPNQDYMVWMSEKISGGIGISINKIMRTNFKKEINGRCPAMDKQIDEKGYKIEDFIEMLQEYDKMCQ